MRNIEFLRGRSVRFFVAAGAVSACLSVLTRIATSGENDFRSVDKASSEIHHSVFVDLGGLKVQRCLGWLYDEGVGKSPGEDYALYQKFTAEAFNWFRTYAELGAAGAQCHLGMMYASGDGMRPNPVEAVKWYRKSADQNYAAAQCKLASMYARGEGVEMDPAEALKWYRKAAVQGNEKAKAALKQMGAD